MKILVVFLILFSLAIVIGIFVALINNPNKRITKEEYDEFLSKQAEREK